MVSAVFIIRLREGLTARVHAARRKGPAMDPIATAQYGMLAASRRFDASASRVARMGVEGQSVDLPAEVVEQITAQTAFAANAAVIRSAQDMAGKLLDVLA
jgi:flagellar basal body rod protein FlgG